MTHPAAWLGGCKVLLLSPHPDDIAYSIGGLVALAKGVAELSMLTVFPRSAWALPADLRSQGPDAISPVRAAEDRTFGARHGMAYHPLDFGDSSCHGYDEDGEMAADPADDPRAERVCDTLHARVRALSPDLVLAPASIGGHVDHRIVTEAARRLDGVGVAFYEDLPYAAWQMLGAIERSLTGAGLSPFALVDIGNVIDEKIAGMWVYETQTSAGTVSEMLLHAARLGGGGLRYAERIWL